tara:strand:+ start:205 stop:537 length:333 start_codon:yes stop_codon:yes gene_type:complete
LFTLENIIGDIVFVSLRDKSFLSKIAIPEDLNHFKIMGQDQLGLWVEHPQLTFKYKLDKNGDSIAKNEQKTERVDAVFLIAWGNIDTIMHYPNREGYDFPSEFETDIGFK